MFPVFPHARSFFVSHRRGRRMEGDEEKLPTVFYGANSHMEKQNRMKRIKTMRLMLERGEYAGVNLRCTRNRGETIDLLIGHLEELQKSFDPRRPPVKTMKQLKAEIGARMKDRTFLEYLRLRRMPGIGVVKAMKVSLFQAPPGFARLPSSHVLVVRIASFRRSWIPVVTGTSHLVRLYVH